MLRQEKCGNEDLILDMRQQKTAFVQARKLNPYITEKAILHFKKRKFTIHHLQIISAKGFVECESDKNHEEADILHVRYAIYSSGKLLIHGS